MSEKISVQRFVASISPSPSHPELHEWQTGLIVIIIGENDRVKAEKTAVDEIERRHYRRLRFEDRSTLIEPLVRKEGGAIWKAYKQAQEGNMFVLEQLDRIPFVKKGEDHPFRIPRIGECFIDEVIEGAGGKRLSVEEANNHMSKNADYLIGHCVIELKDLQSEGLKVKTRQRKIARLFDFAVRPDRTAVVDLNLLSPEALEEYYGIMGKPIRKRLDSAKAQIKATQEHLDLHESLSGVILLNSGYGTMPQKVLQTVATDYVRKSSSIDFVICISTWCLGDGMDYAIHFEFDSNRDDIEEVQAIQKEFSSRTETLMTEMVLGKLGETQSLDPLQPLYFEEGEIAYTHIPPLPPSSFD